MCRVATISPWSRPQNSLQMIRYVPIFVGVKRRVWTSPGTMSALSRISGTQKPWITELKAELVADRLHRQHAALRVLQTAPNLDAEDRDDDDQDRRKERPPEFEFGVAMNLDADRVGRHPFPIAERDGEVDRVSRDDVKDQDHPDAHELEEGVDLIGRDSRFRQPVAEVLLDEPNDRDDREDGQERRKRPEVRA